jgi:hypothetical protein
LRRLFCAVSPRAGPSPGSDGRAALRGSLETSCCATTRVVDRFGDALGRSPGQNRPFLCSHFWTVTTGNVQTASVLSRHDIDCLHPATKTVTAEPLHDAHNFHGPLYGHRALAAAQTPQTPPPATNQCWDNQRGELRDITSATTAKSTRDAGVGVDRSPGTPAPPSGNAAGSSLPRNANAKRPPGVTDC